MHILKHLAFVRKFAVLAALAVGLPLASEATYTVPKFRINQYYDSNAVLQRGVTLPICGTAEKDKTVTVTFNGQTKSTTANIENEYSSSGVGRWVANFDPVTDTTKTYTIEASDGTTTLTATNIKVGEVWLISGQSNAYYPIERFTLSYSGDPTHCIDEWAKDADYPLVRFIMANEYEHEEYNNTRNPWYVSSADNFGKCSAMAFFFGKELQKAMNIPVGVVTAAKDGSFIKAWQTDGDNFKKYVDNKMEPLLPFPVKGVLWYQGEAEGLSADGYNYRNYLQKMIASWRVKWNAPNLPFYVVQLPIYNPYPLWSEIRDSQTWVSKNVSNTWLVPTLDISDNTNIHPPKKPELGARLSLYARKYTYGETNLHPEGPVYKSCEINPANDKEVLVHFDVTSPITSSDGEALRGFQMGGDYYGQTKFYTATVRIVDEDTIGVTCGESNLKAPFAVRYGFTNFEEVNFFDADGNSPAAFRTDNWKLQTQSAEVHNHEWALSLSGATLTATCSASGCTVGTSTFAIAANPATKSYDGQPLNAVDVNTEFAAMTQSALGGLEYYKNDVKLPGAPVEVGEYEAREDVEHDGVHYVLKLALTITEAGENPPVNPPSGDDDPAGAIAATGDATGATDVGVIQAAINAAKPNGTVTLGSGIFYINTQLLVEGGVTLAGQGWDKTIIKQVASGADCRVATVSGGSTIKRMALTGGRVETTGNYKSAGGVALTGGTISWCCITNNLISAGNVIVGGGVGIYAGKGTIDHSIIADNTVSSSGEFNLYGGGIGVYQASGAITVDSCLIYGNTSVMTKGHRSGNGGGIGVNGSYNTVNVRNTTIVGNVAGKSDGDNKEQSKGGGVYCDGGTFKLTNCVVWNNDTAQDGYDLQFHNTTVALDHCLYATSEYTTDAPARATITACASGDPKFTDGYALASDSPAKGTGVTYTGIGVDLTGADFANPPSMGCYEFGSVPGVLPDVPGGEDDPQVDPPAVKKCGVGLFID